MNNPNEDFTNDNNQQSQSPDSANQRDCNEAATGEEVAQVVGKSKNILRNKNYFLLFQGRITSNIAAMLCNFAISFYILQITDNNALLQGIYLAVCGVVFVVCSPFGGVLADRWNKVVIVYLSDFLRGIVMLATAAVAAYCLPRGIVNLQLVILFVGGILFNVIGAVFSPATTALLPQIVEKAKLQQANSYFSVLNSVESILGVILAGALYSWLSVTTIFIIVGVCYIVSGITELFIRCKHVKPTNALSVKQVFIDLKHGFNYVRTQKALLALVLGILFINFFISPVYSNGIPFFVETYIKGDYLFSSIIKPKMWSSIFSVASGVGSLIAGLIAGAIKQKSRYSKPIKGWLLAVSAVLIIQAIAFMLLVNNGYSLNAYLVVMCLLAFLNGYAVVSVNVPIATVMQSSIEPDMMAKVYGLVNVGSQGLIPVASFLAGVVISSMGLGMLFIFSAVGLTIASVLTAVNKQINDI